MMSGAGVLRVALDGLARAKVRTFLMMLGIIVGVATLTTIVSLGKGAQMKVMKGIRNFGPNSVMVAAGGGRMFGPPDERVTTLSLEDAEAIRTAIPGVRHFAPFTVTLEQSAVAGNRNTTTPVFGVTASWADAWQWEIASGDFLTEEDKAALTRNCVLGQTVARELFGDQNPVGETLRLNSTTFKVVGVLARRGASPHGMDMDRRVLVPITTAMKRLYNITHLGMLRLYLDDASRLDAVTAELQSLLRERHHITPPQEDDFRVTNSQDVARTVQGVSKTLVTFLLLLSLVALGVGGIVIANIMFFAVSERKKEIGIRRAFGARARDIRNQFLCEALMVTVSGGILGIVTGFAVSRVISMIPMTMHGGGAMAGTKVYLPAVISWEPFALAFVFSVIIGLLAGMQPARRAASLDPVEAIRG